MSCLTLLLERGEYNVDDDASVGYLYQMCQWGTVKFGDINSASDWHMNEGIEDN